MDEQTKAAIAVAEMGQAKKLEAYLARGRPLEALTDDELREESRRGLVEWAKDPASFDKMDIVPGDDATAEMTLRGMVAEWSEDDHALLAQAVEKLVPAHEALSQAQRDDATNAMMEQYRSQSTKRH